jgi:N-acetyl-anhydromuramyl-L-alanine amidase AmpD
MNGLTIRDVRADMPNYAHYRDWQRQGAVIGIAVHHSATANSLTGVSMDNAHSVFRHHVDALGWSHGGYHYLVHPNGLIEYALDEQIAAFHAGFSDPEDRLTLEHGQYWNNHFLAVCLLGWFERDRISTHGQPLIPNQFTAPTHGQWQALLALLQDLMQRYGITADTIKGHRELAGCRTQCPGNVDLEAVRTTLTRHTADGER